jgi:hypothetical protein
MKNTEVLENPVTELGIESKNEIIKPSEIPAEVLGWNTVESYTSDIDNDGVTEEVVLVTSAERDKDGEFFWNDGQNWALYIDGKEDYLLYNQYLSTGFPYFEISDYYLKDGTKTHIKLIVSTGASFSVSNYGFSGADGGYVKTVIYDTANVTEGGINRIFSSLPDYDTEE